MSRKAKTWLLASVLVVCCVAVVVRNHVSTASEEVRPSELFRIMAQQFHALQAEDFSQAYAHASFGVQQQMDLLQYAQKTRTELSSVLHSRQFELGTVRSSGKNALLQVFFLDEQGDVTPCLYSFVNEGEGWKVGGIRVLKRWQSGRRLVGSRA